MNPGSGPAVASLSADTSFSLLKEYVIAQTGLAYYADKDGDLARCLATRLSARGLLDCSAYLALLRDPNSGAAELDDLIKDLTIGETFFFRHAELFDALRTLVLPNLLARNRQQRRLRIWSAGCATGAEAYSLSILLRRDLAQQLAGWDVSIVGTDINREFLARAGTGLFEEWALRATSEEVRRDCFTRVGRGWAILPRFQEGVCFQYHNLVTHPYPSLLNNLFAFDLILCRNVMIYFSQEIMRHVLAGFHQSLVEDGWLLVGHSEPSVPLFRSFRAVNASSGPTFYQKATADLVPPVSPLLSPNWSAPIQSMPAPSFSKSSRNSSEKRSQKAVVPVLIGPAPTRGQQVAEPKELTSVRALADQGAWDQALAGCIKLLESERLNPAVHFYHGLVLEQLGRHEEAEAAQRRAIYLNRSFVLAHYYLGLLLQKGHRTEQAAQAFTNVLRLLERLESGHTFDDGDGITAVELAKLTRMHLSVLEGA